MSFSELRHKLLSSTALTRRWNDPLKFAGDMYLAGNFTLIARGGVSLNPYDLTSAITFLLAAGSFSVVGNNKNFVRAGLSFGAIAMSILWAGAIAHARETTNNFNEAIHALDWKVHAGNAAYVGSQLFSLIVPGYQMQLDQKRALPQRIKDAVLANPLQVTGVMALASKIPMATATFAKLLDPKETIASVFFLGVLGCWSAGDIATLCTKRIKTSIIAAGKEKTKTL